jgi:hypothetical protein
MTGKMFNKNESISWHDVKKRREEVKNAYPSIFTIPVMYCTKKELICNVTKNMKGRVLDIGAADRFVQDICTQAGNGIDYRSMDVDKTGFHDYYSLDAIQETFDAIFLLDVLEHVSLSEGRMLLSRCKGMLNLEGRIFVTVPNNNHPTAFGGDCTHLTSYRFHEVGGVLLSAGFKELQIFRISAKKRLRHRLLAFLLSPVLKFLDMDFATGILLIAKRN